MRGGQPEADLTLEMWRAAGGRGEGGESGATGLRTNIRDTSAPERTGRPVSILKRLLALCSAAFTLQFKKQQRWVESVLLPGELEDQLLISNIVERKFFLLLVRIKNHLLCLKGLFNIQVKLKQQYKLARTLRLKSLPEGMLFVKSIPKICLFSFVVSVIKIVLSV